MPAPPAQVTLTLSPTPPAVVWLETMGGTAMFRIASDVTVDMPGGGGQLTTVTTSVTTVQAAQGTPGSFSFTTNSSVSIAFPPSGSVAFAHTTTFGFSSDVQSATWSLMVSGVDRQGRAFSASSPRFDLALPPH